MWISAWGIQTLILFATAAFLVYKYLTRNYDYFKKRNIYFVKPIPIIGSMLPVLTMQFTIGEWLSKLYNSIDEPYFGIFIFDKPTLIIKSPELVKQILIKDFSKFWDRTVLNPGHDELVSEMLFWQTNPEWKNMRTKMTPVFSSGKLKCLLPSMNEVGEELTRYINKNLGKLESKEVSAKFTTDIIVRCAFAVNAGSFEDENSEFRQVARALFGFTWRNAITQSFYFLRQNWATVFRLQFFERWTLQFLKRVFLNSIIKREEANTKGNDFIDTFVEMRKNNKNLDENKVVAQGLQFFIAGFETTSSVISFTLYELCLYPKIQDRLREEILNITEKYNGITYEGLKEMKYMDMCIYETLRKYPVLPFLDRKCNSDYKVEGTDLVIEKDMAVFIPMMALHYDEKYFPDPEKYDPERFTDKHSLNMNGLYYMPFGEGPRICIGQRFGMLKVKVGLAHIISKFILERIPETPVPVRFEAKSFLLQSDVGLPIRFKKFQPTTS